MHDWAGEVRRLGRVGSTPEVDASVVEELVQHLEDRYAELRAEGMDHSSAVAGTLEELAGDPLLGQQLRGARRTSQRSSVPLGSSWGSSPVEVLSKDFRHGIRLAARQPVHTLALVLTLALGIGATTAIFSVVDTILLREPPFAEMDELVMLWETDRNSETIHEPASWPDIVDFRERSRTLDGIGAVEGRQVAWRREDSAEMLNGLAVTGNLPGLLGISPVLGNLFDEERIAGGESAVLLSEHIWRSRLGSDPAVIGSTLWLNDELFTVLGVLPSEVDLGVSQIHARADYGGRFNGRHVDVWLGMAPSAAEFPRETHPFFTVGRLAPGASMDAAQSELASIASDLEAAYPENSARGVNVEPLSEVIFGPSRPALLVLMGAVGLVLLITCANVANLMMARMAGRRRELTVRVALGARGWRMASQLLMETLVVTSLGAAVGLGIAYAGVRWIVSIAPESIPRMDEVSIDWSVLAAFGCVTIALTLILGVLPMRRVWGSDQRSSVQGIVGGRSPEGTAGAGARAGLVISQTALAVALVTGAGILLRSLFALLSVDPGFDTDRVIKVEYQLPPVRYAIDFARPETFIPTTTFYSEVLGRMRSIPGVEEAAFAASHPLQPGFTNSFTIIGREAESANFPEIRTRFVSPAYQETLGIPLLSGRTLSESDDLVSPRVGVLNDAASELYFPNGDAIGQEIRFWGQSWRVVGVMGDERFLGVDRDSEPAIYGSLQQMPLGGGSILVRTREDVAGTTAAIRNAVHEVDPQIVLHSIETLDETLAATIGSPRFTTMLVGMFAALAALIALVGLHGLLSYSVSQRAPELGIRKALGASDKDLRRLVLGEGLRLGTVGVAVGAGLALIGSRVLGSLVFGVSAADPFTFAAVALGTLCATLLASWLPARRASASDPLGLLRSE